MAKVVREYLHITATVVAMKFPQIQHMSSEELIQRVKNYEFWEYHDRMIRIMLKEKQKMVDKERAEMEAKAASGNTSNHKQQTNQSGMHRDLEKYLIHLLCLMIKRLDSKSYEIV